MHRVITFTLLLFFLFDFRGVAQSNIDYLFENAENYDPSRFANSIGSPYLFDPWVVGKTFTHTGETYYPLLMNYNVQEKRWEARSQNKVIILDPNFFWCVIVRSNDNPFSGIAEADSLLFIKGMLKDNEEAFSQIIYNGQRLKLIKRFVVTRSKQNSGAEGGFSIYRYLHRSTYYLKYDDQEKKFSLQKKELAKAIGIKKKEITEYLESYDQTPVSESDWKLLLAEIEKEFLLGFY